MWVVRVLGPDSWSDWWSHTILSVVAVSGNEGYGHVVLESGDGTVILILPGFGTVDIYLSACGWKLAGRLEWSGEVVPWRGNYWDAPEILVE